MSVTAPAPAPAAAYRQMNNSDLKSFLSDIRQNITHDDLVDFKKLLLYLFQFTQGKLQIVTTHYQRHDPYDEAFQENLDLLDRLLETIELVFSKRRHLLNTQLSDDEKHLIYILTEYCYDGGKSDFLYDWAIYFGLTWLPQFPQNSSLTATIKSYIMKIIDLIAVQLQNFRYKRKIRASLLQSLSIILDHLLEKIGTINNPKDFQAFSIPLSCGVHLFTILISNDITNKLLLNLPEVQLKLDSFTKKISFIIDSIHLPQVATAEIDIRQDFSVKCVDDIRSEFLNSLTTNLMLNDAVTWNSICWLISWIEEYIKTLDNDICINQGNSYNCYLDNFNNSISYFLLRVFQLCREKQVLSNLMNALSLESLSIIKEDFEDSESSTFPLILRKALYTIYYQYNVHINNQRVMNEYTLSSKNLFIATSFNYLQLDNVKNDVVYDPKFHKYRITASLLSFDVPSVKLRSSFIKPHSGESEIQFDFMGWLKMVRSLIKQDLAQPSLNLFSDRKTLYSFITALGHFPCLFNNDYNFDAEECAKCGELSNDKKLYGNISPSRRSIVNGGQEISVFYFDIIINFLLSKRQNMKDDPLICCNFFLTIFKIFSSFSPSPSNHQDDLLLFIIEQISNCSNRDVRLLASRILPLYLILPKDEVLDQNFKFIFSSLSKIDFHGESKKIHLAECTIQALSNLAVISDGDWLYVILVNLIDTLGGANEQHSNLAFNGLLFIASNKAVTPYRVLSPFLPHIAERVLKNPRLLSKLIDILGITKNSFLAKTHEYTIPRYLEYYKYDYIEEIAKVCRKPKGALIWSLLPRIFATYLVKDEVINETYIMNVLGNVHPEFKRMKFKDVLGQSSICDVTWYTLLQIQVDLNGGIINESKINNALYYIAKIGLGSKLIHENDHQSDAIKTLLGKNVLQLVQKFSDIVHGSTAKPYLEMALSIKAMELLINSNVTATASALGQISTCLQTAFEDPDFELPAIRCWNVLVQNLSIESLLPLFDIIICMIFQKFQDLEHRSKLVAAKILEKLLGEGTRKYINYCLYYLSIVSIDTLDHYLPPNRPINLMEKSQIHSYLSEFARRLRINNKFVVQQALNDLVYFLQQFDSDQFRKSIFEASIHDLVRALLDTAVYFKSRIEEIPTLCARALSIIGALDVNKFNAGPIRNRDIVLYDFRNYEENAKFLNHFIEQRVITMFWASNDAIKQLYLSYSMQEFLKVLKIDDSVLNPSTQDLSEIWNQFSDVARSTLAPFIKSNYTSLSSRYVSLKIPFYKTGMKHDKWLFSFTLDLLKRPLENISDGENSPKNVIFQTFSSLIRVNDTSICQHILKYIALSHVINGNSQVYDDIKTEFLSVLEVDMNDINYSDLIEQLKSCYQTIFEVLDYFSEWQSEAIHFLSKLKSRSLEGTRLTQNIKCVSRFLKEIPTELIVTTSSKCDSYERTILYVEKCYREGNFSLTNQIGNLNLVSTLQSIYSSINDYDALSGVLKVFSTNNLQEKLNTFQYNENWMLAQESFQVMSKVGTKEDKVKNYTKLLKSLSDHALYDDVLTTLSGRSLTKEFLEVPFEWLLIGLQAAIYSGEIDQVNYWLFKSDLFSRPDDIEDVINHLYALALKSIHENQKNNFETIMERIYKTIGSNLVSSMSSSFSKNSGLMLKLHTMYDTSLIVKTNNDKKTQLEVERILNNRLGNIDQTFDSQWRVLNMHRVVNSMIQNDANELDYLVKCSKIARKYEKLNIATKITMKLMALNYQEANLEYTELLWAQDKRTEAIKLLFDIIQEDRFKTRSQKSNAQLQYAEWLDESNHSSFITIINEYKKAIAREPAWSRAYYELAKYYGKVIELRSDLDGQYELELVRNYLKSLAVDASYIFEALPKAITIWLDYCQVYFETKKRFKEVSPDLVDSDRQRSLDRERSRNKQRLNLAHKQKSKDSMTDAFKTYADKIPIYVWYTSITQLLSRISIYDKKCGEVLKHIVTSLINEYTEHSLWYVFSHITSESRTRMRRVSQVLAASKRSNKKRSNTIKNAEKLFFSLVYIGELSVPRNFKGALSLSKNCNLAHLQNPDRSLVIPVKSNLEIRLPGGRYEKEFNGFPKSSNVTFDGVDDSITMFQSLQKPKLIVIRGSDLKTYKLLLKRDDDTRKDAKVVGLNTMINRLLKVNTETRKRNLSIAYYSVIPLKANVGVIEFLSNVATVKKLIFTIRERIDNLRVEREASRLMAQARIPIKTALTEIQPVESNLMQQYFDKLLEIYRNAVESNPPVLHQWFIEQFSDPTAWYIARNRFVRSTAVMSIVGYILGLGDRHLDNILLFTKSGELLHIDFDCLFDKAKTLPVPETVPFRLTQTMIDPMGVSSYEGTFRITCEVTASLLREHETPFMNNLETLLYDPLIDWQPEKSNSKKRSENKPANWRRAKLTVEKDDEFTDYSDFSDGSDYDDEDVTRLKRRRTTLHIIEPKLLFLRVKKKIQGFVEERELLPMNVQAQVDYLIQEAISDENLSKMFHGWAPYL